MNDNDGKLNVVHIFSGDLWAGAEVMIFNLLSELTKAPDIKISALSLNEGVLTRKLREAGVITHVIPENNISFPNIFLPALHLLKKEKIDIIHSHRYKENILAFLLANSLGVKKLVATVHGLPELYNEREKLPVKTRVDHFILKNCFSSVVAVSRELKDAMIQRHGFYGRNVEAIHNGIPAPVNERYAIAQKKGGFHIGTVGRMEPVKDLSLFLETAAWLKRRKKNVRFSILGEGTQKKELINRANVLGLSEIIEFPSFLSDPTDYYRSLDIYLNTSVHEGIPMSVLEAMACGIPAVAPDVGGLPEIITHGKDGFLVKEREAAGFGHYCLKLMTEKGTMSNFSKNAVHKIRHSFNSSKTAESYSGLYSVL